MDFVTGEESSCIGSSSVVEGKKKVKVLQASVLVSSAASDKSMPVPLKVV